ncbi:anaerobic dimethyl sulfoxide reductase subunit B [Salmonella enterica subsp. enterica serovar Typhimurium str. DT104]|nr:anaerobic dimethyl sulfoxide reductase subunit B [Salmonella enterica subsp. enterica serovar Typhimurium str. DT104]
MGSGWHEWPLMIFTVFGQCVVGALIVSGLGWLTAKDDTIARQRIVDGCYDRVAEGKKPICVESCPLRALDFGPIDELRKKHGELAAVAPLPRAHFTKPNIVIKPNANSRPTGDTTGYLANPKEV